MRRKFIKDCKRILSAMFCAVTTVVFAMAGAGKASAEGAAQLVVSAVEGYEGDTVTVSVALENNPGIAGTAFQLEYDTSVLELVGIVMDPETEDVKDSIWAGPTMKDDTPGIVTYANAREKNVTKSGNLFQVEFKIVDGANIGESALTLGGRLEFVNADEQDIEITSVNGKVTVACKHTNTADTTTEATCTANGKIVTICNKCGQEISMTPIPAKGHVFGDVQTVTAPTCTDAGKGVKTCTVCNTIEDVELPAKGHTFKEYKVTKEVTEDVEGKISVICADCDTTITKTIPALKKIKGDVAITAPDGNKLNTVYKVGDTITFVAVGIGMDNASPQVGDIRFVPVSWKLNGVETKWGRVYDASFSADKAGDYHVAVVYVMEIFGINGWEAKEETVEYAVTILAEEADTEPVTNENNTTADSKTENPASGEENKTTAGSDKNQPAKGKNESANGNVKTGDNAGTAAAVLFLVCAVSGAVAVIVYKKRAVR